MSRQSGKIYGAERDVLTWPSCVKYGTAAQQTAQIRHTYSVQPKQQNGGRGAYLQDDWVNRRHREQPFSRSFLVVFFTRTIYSYVRNFKPLAPHNNDEKQHLSLFFQRCSLAGGLLFRGRSSSYVSNA